MTLLIIKYEMYLMIRSILFFRSLTKCENVFGNSDLLYWQFAIRILFVLRYSPILNYTVQVQSESLLSLHMVLKKYEVYLTRRKSEEVGILIVVLHSNCSQY